MKKNMITKLTIAGFACIMSASVSLAANTYDTFGPLSSLTAGGTPGKDVAISQNANSSLTLGLAAQQRYNNPTPSSSAGTYFATTGKNYGTPATPTTPGTPSSFQGSTWNFDFYIGGPSVAGYTYSLTYGLDGGTVYSFNPLADADAVTAFGSTGAYQDSQNLLFGTFGGAVNGFAGTFDPNADATYDFLLTATPLTGGPSVQSGITVVVGKGSSVPDSGSTLALMGLAFAGIAGLRRKLLA
jgi:hypothetical protein